MLSFLTGQLLTHGNLKDAAQGGVAVTGGAHYLKTAGMGQGGGKTGAEFLRAVGDENSCRMIHNRLLLSFEFGAHIRGPSELTPIM